MSPPRRPKPETLLRPPSRSALGRVFLAAAVLLAGCEGPSVSAVPDQDDDPDLIGDLACSIDVGQITDAGVAVEAIPALTDPPFVEPWDPGAAYLNASVAGLPNPRVVGLVIDGQAYAIPYHILWWHEIVNLDFDSGLELAVTYAPLTGSALVFDRTALSGASLGVSGLLFRSNLIMHDRRSDRSLWPQMLRAAGCGPADGTALAMYPAFDLTWEGWQNLHPGTRVVSSETGYLRDYTDFPFGDYEQTEQLWVQIDSIDGRRPLKERVFGFPEVEGGGALALPFEELSLAAESGVAVVEVASSDGARVVFWSDVALSAVAFDPHVDGQRLTFRVQEGAFVDEQTGSEWTLDGRAERGPLEETGAALEPEADAHVAFWFAWAAFHRGTEIWEH